MFSAWIKELDLNDEQENKEHLNIRRFFNLHCTFDKTTSNKTLIKSFSSLRFSYENRFLVSSEFANLYKNYFEDWEYYKEKADVENIRKVKNQLDTISIFLSHDALGNTGHFAYFARDLQVAENLFFYENGFPIIQDLVERMVLNRIAYFNVSGHIFERSAYLDENNKRKISNLYLCLLAASTNNEFMEIYLRGYRKNSFTDKDKKKLKNNANENIVKIGTFFKNLKEVDIDIIFSNEWYRYEANKTRHLVEILLKGVHEKEYMNIFKICYSKMRKEKLQIFFLLASYFLGINEILYEEIPNIFENKDFENNRLQQIIMFLPLMTGDFNLYKILRKQKVCFNFLEIGYCTNFRNREVYLEISNTIKTNLSHCQEKFPDFVKYKYGLHHMNPLVDSFFYAYVSDGLLLPLAKPGFSKYDIRNENFKMYKCLSDICRKDNPIIGIPIYNDTAIESNEIFCNAAFELIKPKNDYLEKKFTNLPKKLISRIIALQVLPTVFQITNFQNQCTKRPLRIENVEYLLKEITSM